MKKRLFNFILTMLLGMSVIGFAEIFVSSSDSTPFLITDDELYNQTNIYEYNKNFRPNEARYNFNVETKIDVDEGGPLITVFTHGLGGSASHWSNDGRNTFAYSEHSLITRLAKSIDSNIYWAIVDDSKNLEILDITNEVYYGIDNNIPRKYVGKEVRNVSNINKHTIIVFEASDEASGGSNDEVYTEFNYAISRIVYDVRRANGGYLPKINLIGHSRGGITNMQYALDHPALVHSIYSLGTPYTGSTTASLDLHWFGARFSGSEEASRDIVSKDVYGKYMDRWNSNYDELYSHINVVALAGYGTLLQFFESLISDKSLNYFFDGENINKELIRNVVRVASGIIQGIILNQYLSPSGITKAVIGKHIGGVFSELATNFGLFSNIAFDDLVQIITNEINLDYHPPFISWYNDVLVDLGSQLGYEGLVPLDGQQYKGFRRFTKTYMLYNSEFDITSNSLPSVIHNLEARDKELGTYILADISTGLRINNEYEIYKISDNEVGISAYIGKTTSTTLTIPEYINGFKVVAIGDYAFANNAYGQENLTTIEIPKSVRVIGKNAFYNSDQITNITFIENSELTEIHEGAFSLLPNLSNFKIPSNVQYIGERAFADSGITSFNVSENSNYLWKNNFLIDTNVSDNSSFVAIYANPTITNFTVPSDVKILAPYLFENNRQIQSINLNQVEYIGDYAFHNSSLTNITGGTRLKSSGNLALQSTPWFIDQDSDFVIIGSVLLKYTGLDSNVVVPEGITRIAEECFESPLIRTIILPSTINTIGQNAFTKSINLESILFTATQPPVLDGDCFQDDVILYVKGTSINYYTNNIYFKNISNSIRTKSITIEFFNRNGNKLGTRQEEYGTSFNNYITAPAITGMDFVHWVDENNNIYKPQDYLDVYHDLKLYPIYEKSKYTVNIIDDGSSNSIEISYGETLQLEVPQEPGYRFIGWYDKPSGGNLIVDKSGVVVWYRTNKIDYLYARYQLITYFITYNTDKGEFVDGYRPTSFTVESPVTLDQIPEVRRFGYVFDGWTYNGVEFVTTNGIYQDIIIRAKWLGIERKYNNGVTTSISDEYAIINLSGADATKTYHFTILGNVKTVTFIGSSNKNFERMRITIATRGNALVLGFESMNFKPQKSTTGDGYNAVTTSSNFELFVVYKNENTIRGGEGADGTSYYNTHPKATNNQNGIAGVTGGAGGNGGHGIVAYKVTFSEYDQNSKINIYGGTGGAGGRGGNGQDGSDGVNGPSGSFLKPKKGDNGARGGTGGTGGRGGDGGYAVKVASSTYLKVSETGQYNFVGGIGGNGGQGGYGGNGGKGASDTSGNIFKGVGDPGDGGDGGTGGNGGRGGNGSAATNALYVYGTGGAGGAGGAGNRGGYGGAGGSAGSHGSDGSSGRNGSNGRAGSNGSSGTTGYNTVGSSSGYRSLPYAYSHKFFEMVAY